MAEASAEPEVHVRMFSQPRFLAAVRALVDRAGSPPHMIDIEAALERIGRRACLRGRVSRCPLGSDCPLFEAPGVRDA